ncbi:MAG: WSD1 family O-acyltransferase [Nocardiaceae bacterium]|nr:WSD1 family O-acyltransferase [Nocardiaceae bacterium]
MWTWRTTCTPRPFRPATTGRWLSLSPSLLRSRWTARTAGAALRFGASPLLRPAVNVAISNVPGSPTTLFCAGAEQRMQYPVSGVMHGIGLNITVFSYRDTLGIGIVADRGQLDDAWPLLGAIQDALSELTGLLPDM